MTFKLDTFLDGANSTYLLELAKQYENDPHSVPEDWWPLFDDITNGQLEKKPNWGLNLQALDAESNTSSTGVAEKSASKNACSVSKLDILDTLRVIMLIDAYRNYGHMLASLDPLELEKPLHHQELNPEFYGFTPDDYNRSIFVNGQLGFENATLNQILQKLKSIYKTTIGLEFTYIQRDDQKLWLQHQFESNPNDQKIPNPKTILKELTRAEFFEKTIHVKFPGAKRFGLDGGESLIPALEFMLENKAENGVEEIVFGMAHRGRLSVLTHILGKPLESILGQFDGISYLPDDFDASGDVKYHLGFSSDRTLNNHDVHLSLVPNPSHLEAVNPVVLGKVRARQDQKNDTNRTKVLGVLIHGDAAFSGQGIVPESLAMCHLEGFQTGGTLHIIINNQVGFTTNPSASRSTPYTSDIAKFINAPILHVNGDDPEAVLRAIKIATDFHEQFKHDVIIDLVCYRRYGHNEGDEPFFTQPTMYTKIKSHPTTRALYESKLLKKGIISETEAQSIRDDANYVIKNAHAAVQKEKSGEATREKKPDWREGRWSNVEGLAKSGVLLKPIKTGIDVKDLKRIGEHILKVPTNFEVNSKISRQMDLKKKAIQSGEGIDWGMAESLAFGTLLCENHTVRLCGQDVERGTFSHRHAVLTDQKSEQKYIPLNHIEYEQSKFEVVNSFLSELAVVGFEYGYTSASPNNLVCWEAQFGDFSNGAQIIIDQFISSAESKWLRLSGLVMLLPHGYEGQGPEHSSARLERYLQLCAENNMYVINCTTPANYFHALRRQIHSPYRKPLIVMSPKSLLRHKKVVSNLSEMGKNTHFKPTIDDTKIDPTNAKRLVFCSGKVYYDLLDARDHHGIDDVAIIRLEQYYPFPHDEVVKILKRFNQCPVFWCQEEPENMGAWHFVDRRFEKALTEAFGEMQRPLYVGRKPAASPATGLASRHLEEQNKLIHDALGVSKSST